MTKLTKPVRRETEALSRGRNLIIQLEPPYVVRVKEKGRRQWFSTTVQAIHDMAAKQEAEHIRKERRLAKTKKGERRCQT